MNFEKNFVDLQICTKYIKVYKKYLIKITKLKKIKIYQTVFYINFHEKIKQNYFIHHSYKSYKLITNL